MKDNLPYFSHDNNARRHPKMKALIAEFGYEGYGRFWALNERIAESSGAYIDISKKVNKLDLAQELGLDGNGLDSFLNFLSDPEIDLINLQDGKITTDRITEIFSYTMEYRENEREKKQRKKGKEGFPEGNNDFPEGKEGFPEEFPREKDTNKLNKTKLNKTKLKETKQDPNGSDKPPDKKPIALLNREPKNDMERINKKWLENYIAIHGAQPIDPEWDISSPLVSKVLKQAGVEKILQALDNAKDDNFCLQSGYILKVIMSRNVITKLINKPITQRHRIAADNVPQGKASSYFREE